MRPAAALPKPGRLVLPVSGMHCASCVAKLEKAVGAVAGATSTVRFGTRVLIPTYRHPVVLAKEINQRGRQAHDDATSDELHAVLRKTG